jgi:phage FluMu protein Com
MDDKVKIRCPGCTKLFGERAGKVRDGVQLNCPNCYKLLTLNRDTDDPFFRRALKQAKDIRAIAQAKIVEKAYGPNGAGSPQA